MFNLGNPASFLAPGLPQTQDPKRQMLAKMLLPGVPQGATGGGQGMSALMPNMPGLGKGGLFG